MRILLLPCLPGRQGGCHHSQIWLGYRRSQRQSADHKDKANAGAGWESLNGWKWGLEMHCMRVAGLAPLTPSPSLSCFLDPIGFFNRTKSPWQGEKVWGKLEPGTNNKRNLLVEFFITFLPIIQALNLLIISQR